MIYISYYTKNTPYEQVIKKRLLPSLKKWNLKYDIQGVKDFGNWQRNTHYKAEFIKSMLLKHKESIIFLDADATIEDYPKLFDRIERHKFYDLAFHTLDWELQWRGRTGNKKETLSGTLYVNYTKKSLEFLDAWIRKNKIDTKWEQKNMEDVLKIWKNKLNIYELPSNYATIILHNGEIPKHIKHPVIIHHQASRKLKNKSYHV